MVSAQRIDYLLALVIDCVHGRYLCPLRWIWKNQRVCAWAIRLDGSDDPPVVVDFDTQFRSWKESALSFSQPLYAWMWDYSVTVERMGKDGLLIQAQNRPLSEEGLQS